MTTVLTFGSCFRTNIENCLKILSAGEKWFLSQKLKYPCLIVIFILEFSARLESYRNHYLDVDYELSFMEKIEKQSVLKFRTALYKSGRLFK